jgi:serine protease Do
MRKRTLLMVAVVPLIALVALSAYELGSTRNQSAAALVSPDQSPAVIAVPAPAAGGTTANQQASSQAAENPSTQPASAPPAIDAASASLLAAYEGTLEKIYAQDDPSVVNIHVLEEVASSAGAFSGTPRLGLFGRMVPQGPQVQEGLGSGFVWDQAGHIVTNNHVVDGATQISVRFRDGTTVPAKVVGKDLNSDLAVIQVQAPASELAPVRLADSGQLRVGQLVVAIGNPFGLQGSMSAGIVSALDRSLPVNGTNSQGPTYSIPDIIQTDAPINPGNSGGVLADDTGSVIGVTAAIESPVGASAGIGFAIPSAIVQKVVPMLIKAGRYDWPWLGVSGTDLDSNLAKAMGLNPDQHGALLDTIDPGSPADKAGLRGSTKQVSIQGQTEMVGGDVIIAIDNQPMTSSDDVIAYLADKTAVGQNVTLTILRQGKEQTIRLTLAARPPEKTQQAAATGAYLGATGVTLTPEIANAMALSPDQQGILIEAVDQGSPAERAGLRGSRTSVTINGQQEQIGGDIIVALDGQQVTREQDLEAFLQQSQPGENALVTVVRGGRELQAVVSLDNLPAMSTT